MILYADQQNFLRILRSVPGTDIKYACQMAGIPRAAIYRLMAKDSQFKQKVNNARSGKRAGPVKRAHMSLIQRALDGDTKAMIKYMDVVYGKPGRQVPQFIDKDGNQVDIISYFEKILQNIKIIAKISRNESIRSAYYDIKETVKKLKKIY